MIKGQEKKKRVNTVPWSNKLEIKVKLFSFFIHQGTKKEGLADLTSSWTCLEMYSNVIPRKMSSYMFPNMAASLIVYSVHFLKLGNYHIFNFLRIKEETRNSAGRRKELWKQTTKKRSDFFSFCSWAKLFRYICYQSVFN